MLACAFCALGSPGSIAAAGIMGGWASAVFVLGPYGLPERIKHTWGVPRFRITDFLSLFLLLLAPLLLARHARNEYEFAYIATCFFVFALCIGFIWLRGLWVLQQCQVGSMVRRTLFLGVLLPATVLFGIVVGHWIFSLLIFLVFPDIAFLLAQSTVHFLIAGLIFAFTRTGLTYVFGKPALRQFVIENPSEEIETVSMRARGRQRKMLP